MTRALREALKRALTRTVFRLNLFLPFVRDRRFVFLYHDVSDPDAPHHYPVYSTTPSRFREQLHKLKSLFRLTTLRELLDSDSPENLASIVFDDGFRSVLRNAWPILNEQDIPFTVFLNKAAVETGSLWCSDVVLGRRDPAYLRRLYDRYVENLVSFEEFTTEPMAQLVTTSRLGDDYADFAYPGLRVYLDAGEVRLLMDRGATIGSHGASHRVTARLSDHALQVEIVDNRRFLEALVGRAVEHFALPFGFDGTYDARALVLARREHRYVYSTRRLSFFRRDVDHSTFLVPRIGMANEGPSEILAAVAVSVLASHELVYEA